MTRPYLATYTSIAPFYNTLGNIFFFWMVIPKNVHGAHLHLYFRICKIRFSHDAAKLLEKKITTMLPNATNVIFNYIFFSRSF